tara:strand:+ start:38923 stop:39339 length:417 start_codon:yes stop_codon:yes gene_type:complete
MELLLSTQLHVNHACLDFSNNQWAVLNASLVLTTPTATNRIVRHVTIVRKMQSANLNPAVLCSAYAQPDTNCTMAYVNHVALGLPKQQTVIKTANLVSPDSTPCMVQQTAPPALLAPFNFPQVKVSVTSALITVSVPI